MLRQLTEQLYIIDGTLPFLGSKVYIRMTVIRLADGGLLVIDPIVPSEELFNAVGELGPVTYIIAPNRFHHLFINAWSARFKQATVLAAPGLPERIKTLHYDRIINADSMAALQTDLDWLLFDAAPTFNEIVLLHKPSRTLILTDLAFNIQHAGWSLWGIYIRLSGAFKRFGLSRLLRFTVRNRPRARVLIDQILEWDFDRIIVAHGDIIECDGKSALRKAYDWL